MTITPIEMAALMLGWHALADYPLQGDFMARGKNPALPLPGVPWEIIMGSHALIHGVGVGIITGSVLLGMAEVVAHSLIDVAKCYGKIGFRADQYLHVACKGAWVALVMAGAT